jgi:hypothetical protein
LSLLGLAYLGWGTYLAGFLPKYVVNHLKIRLVNTFSSVCKKVKMLPSLLFVAIAIETGVQNTGIAIFLLSSLDQPYADLTTVIPGK